MLGDQAAGRPELIHAIWEQGHAIGNHTYNHNYHDLYSGFTEFWRQIKQTEETVREITGVRPQLVRAPGGTFGHFDSTYFNLLKQAGYRVMDWTVDSGDSRRRGVPAAEIVQASVADLNSASVVLLLHDGSGHEQSAKALPAIIERYRAAGYEFGVLDTQSDPVQFRVSSKAASLQRGKPSQDWISANIAPNAELFATGKALALEIGRMEIKLKPGEYRLQDGQYYVPLRATVERLGGRVGWDADTRSAAVSWNGRSMTLDSQKQEVGIHWPDGTAEYRAAQVQLQGSSLWVPCVCCWRWQVIRVRKPLLMQRSAGLLQLKADIRFGGGLDGGDGRMRQGRQGAGGKSDYWREKRLLNVWASFFVERIDSNRPQQVV